MSIHPVSSRTGTGFQSRTGFKMLFGDQSESLQQRRSRIDVAVSFGAERSGT
jgi:hypothetical protein